MRPIWTPNSRQAEHEPDDRDGDAREDQHAIDAGELVIGRFAVEDPLGLGEDGLEPAVDPARSERQPEEHPEQHGRDREQDQRDRHDQRQFVDAVPDRLRAAERSPERQAHQPEHVERGQPGDDEADQPDPPEAELQRLTEDLVLREEPGQRRDAGDRQRPDEHRRVGDRDLPAEAAHVPHVLFVVDRMDHRTRIRGTGGP